MNPSAGNKVKYPEIWKSHREIDLASWTRVLMARMHQKMYGSSWTKEINPHKKRLENGGTSHDPKHVNWRDVEARDSISTCAFPVSLASLTGFFPPKGCKPCDDTIGFYKKLKVTQRTTFNEKHVLTIILSSIMLWWLRSKNFNPRALIQWKRMEQWWENSI